MDPLVLFRSVSTRTVWKLFGAMLVATTLFAGGAERAAEPTRGAQLTLDWVDNTGGTANFLVERKTGTTGTYARIATTGIGVTTYTDLASSRASRIATGSSLERPRRSLVTRTRPASPSPSDSKVARRFRGLRLRLSSR